MRKETMYLSALFECLWSPEALAATETEKTNAAHDFKDRLVKIIFINTAKLPTEISIKNQYKEVSP